MLFKPNKLNYQPLFGKGARGSGRVDQTRESDGNRAYKPEEFQKTSVLRFSEDRKHFAKKIFWKTIKSLLTCDFPVRVFLKYKSKITGDCYVSKFLLLCVDEADVLLI